MHSLEVIQARNVAAVYRAMGEAIAEDSVSGYLRARQIAKANPDLYLHDGRRQTAVLYDTDGVALHTEVQR